MTAQAVLLHLGESLRFARGDVQAALQELCKERSIDTAKLQEGAAAGRGAAWEAAARLAGQSTSAALQDACLHKLRARWAAHAHVPGLSRLLLHLWSHDVPLVIVTSGQSSAEQPSTPLLHLFKVHESVCSASDAPQLQEAFQQAAAALQTPAAQCLTLDDAAAGSQAALDAGMQSVMLGKADAAPEGASAMASLLDLRLSQWGLPDFGDRVEGAVPLQPPWTLHGKVVKGFGRGSKELGIPTANVDAAALQAALAETVTGIYCGWARLGSQAATYQMVMSIGYNPFYSNKQKTAEAWLLHTFPADFYGEELRLVIVAYIRPEANFTTVEALIEQIHGDADVTRRLLARSSMDQLQRHSFLWPEPSDDFDI